MLLLDEADGFLERWQASVVSDNALVSVFLRALEYFQGIFFLTTNRLTNIDEAIRSRVHLGINYDELDVQTRKDIWKLFINKVKALPNVEIVDITKEDYQKLASYEINGREVWETFIDHSPYTTG